MSAIDADPEIQAIQALVQHLGRLTPAARARVLAWAGDRFGDLASDLAKPPDRPLALLPREPPAPAIPRHHIQVGTDD